MKTNIGPSLYIPTDKNIFDALLHKKVTFKKLQEFLLMRGILISDQLSKEEVSRMISQLIFDFHDYTKLKELLENTNRKEKQKTITLKIKSTDDEVTNICNKVVADNINSYNNDSYKVIRRNNSTLLRVLYTEIDFTKTELRQRTSKTCDIILETTKTEVLIHQPATKKGSEIVSLIINSFKKNKQSDIIEEKISLETITSPEKRSEFFHCLIQSVNGYELEDVTNIDVHHSIDTLSVDLDEEDNLSNLTGSIKKAALTGDGVHLSKELQQLHKKGFFISKIVWKSKGNLYKGNIVEFEVMFGNASSCTDFKYLIRGVYDFNDRNGRNNTTRRNATRYELDVLNKKIVEASKYSYLKLV